MHLTDNGLIVCMATFLAMPKLGQTVSNLQLKAWVSDKEKWLLRELDYE